MVHLRLNEREANPNKHVNFMSPLPAPEIPSPYSEEDARQLLRALAAQVRPIMKSHGFAVNSLEEVRPSADRIVKILMLCSMSTIECLLVGTGTTGRPLVGISLTVVMAVVTSSSELVLRRVDGTFVPIPWLLSTFCHEVSIVL